MLRRRKSSGNNWSDIAPWLFKRCTRYSSWSIHYL